MTRVYLPTVGSDGTVGGPGGTPVSVQQWQPITSYVAAQLVAYQGAMYLAAVAHTSAGTFNPAHWTAVSGNAAAISFALTLG